MPGNQPTALEQARQALRHGRPDTAERLAQRILEADPAQVEAWRVVAEARESQGRAEESLAAWEHLVRLAPDDPRPRCDFASALARLGRHGDALGLLRELLARWPEHAEAHVQLGILLAEAGQHGPALTYLRRSVELRPDSATARHNLGVALAEAGDSESALTQIGEAVRLDPEYAEAHANLGNVLWQAGKREEALSAYRRALALRPTHTGALTNLGLRLQEMRRPGEAMILLAQAARLRPGDHEAQNNLGLALAELGRFAEAEQAYREALRLAPTYPDAHVNLGSTLKEMGHTEEAVACYDLALWLEPGSRSARYNRSLTLLQSGDWARGWSEYEARWGRKSDPDRTFEKPRWRGEEVAGKSILLWVEQGLGDMIQFSRYAQALKARGARVVLECPGIVTRLLERCAGVDQVVAEGETLPVYDFQVPLMSLPGLFGVTPWRDVVSVPYLTVESERVARWRERLGPARGLRVGVTWQGNPYFQWDRWRSIPLRQFASLAAVEGVELVCLQKEHGMEQLDQVTGRFALRQLDGLDADAAFLDTAAVLSCLDLLVCADTAVGHLAGALGVPVWLPLADVCDWRWTRQRNETVWYPNHRLFRQRNLGDWSDVFATMAAELTKLAQAKASRGMLNIPVPAGEYLDRLTIAQLKAQRISDAGKRSAVLAELTALEQSGTSLVLDAESRTLLAKLAEVNGRLWDVEDALRDCESAMDFSPRFVELARSVYKLNEERGTLKRQLSVRLGAAWAEQKQYGGQR